MSKFFIDRPIFAWVLSIIVCFAGILSLTKMPVEQFPSVSPPTVTITATLPGASADTVENTITQVIEDRLTGVDNMRYFFSSSSAGLSEISVIFEPNTDTDIAQVQVQNKVQTAIPFLPEDAKNQGVLVEKSNPSFLMVVSLYSKSGATKASKLGDLISTDVLETISRVNGVGGINAFSGKYAMRIWLKPEKLYAYNLSSAEVISAIRSQNTEITAGEVGSLPAVKGQQLNATIKVNSKFQTLKEFEDVILISKQDGSVVRLKDVADIELGSESYQTSIRLDKNPAAALAVTLGPSANALSVAKEIKGKMKELEKTLPSDVGITYPYDTTPFVKISIKSVIQTLIEAFILVFLVIFLFLQNFRATLIPSLAIPVVILGTFTLLNLFGFSVNTLTMFAMVLSIGLLVDDAIVVVENVERIMHEEDLSAIEATKKSMEQIKGALIGIGVVLSAVFIPMAFLGGAVGAIYRQFSATIVCSMALSVLVALIFSPSLCATLLKKDSKKTIFTHNIFFTKFNTLIQKGQNTFVFGAKYLLSKTIRFTLVYLVMIGGVIFLFIKMPTSFLPNEDQGAMYFMLATPTGGTMERTIHAIDKVEDYFLENELDNIEAVLTVPGFSFSGISQNSAVGFIKLKDWSKRTKKNQSVEAITGRAMYHLQGIKDAFVFAFFPPPIQELGNSSGFDFQIIDTQNQGHQALMNARNQMLFMASKTPYLTGVRPNGLEDEPQVKLDINYEKASALGVSMDSISQVLNTAFGSAYIGDFIDKGKVKRVYIQGVDTSRMLPSDINQWFVKNNKGEMVSLTSFIDIRWVYGSPKLQRFKGSPSFNIQGSGASGVSSGVAMKVVENLAKKLPKGFEVEWSGISYEEKEAGSQTLFIYIISILFVFLCLAALYESWSVPFSVILVVPFGFLGALLISKIAGLNNDVYFQIAILTTIGLSAKNAILIVEFAKETYESGKGAMESAIHAIHQRFRPIMMTSMAFILGVIPLAISSGAGSNAQNAIGISVIGGMLFATFIAPIFVPFFYVSILKLTTKKV